jgi:hypothetical protein
MATEPVKDFVHMDMNRNPTGIGGFMAGEPSRNPGGRPKGAQAIQNKALSLCSEALDVLTQIMRGQAADKSIASTQLAAAQAILDRGVGKAGQSLALQIDIKKRLSELSREELIALRAQYVAATTPALIEYEPEQES